MMKKHKGGSLGKTLIRDRFKKKQQHRDGDSFLHTSELNDGYDWGRLNLQSVTEQSNLEDFLTTAELAGTDFTAEKLNVKFVDVNKYTGLLSAEEQQHVKKLQDDHRGLLRIPRRPPWDSTTSAEELNKREREAFLEWRRVLSKLQEVEGLVMTPYEKNLDFWRQLWRVIERSDVIVQIVDARCPLLFYCEDLESYVKEVNKDKVNLLLINKADYLTQQQRKLWCDYFSSRNIRIAFWSAMNETERYEMSKKEDAEMKPEIGNVDIDDEEEEDDEEIDEDEHVTDDNDDMDVDDNKDSSNTHKLIDSNEAPQESTVEPSVDLKGQSSSVETVTNKDLPELQEINLSHCDEIRQETMQNIESSSSASRHNCEKCRGEETCTCPSVVDSTCDNVDMQDCDVDASGSEAHLSGNKTLDHNIECNTDTEGVINSDNILIGLELLDLFKTLHKGKTDESHLTTVGMVGYPNVGKSSTINAILKTKKVPVSATPGRTKHFQTLYVDTDLMLCDCPGLVFPSFVSTKADLIINGILPIDQMRDHVPPVSLVCRYIPRPVLESTYGINIPLPQEGEDPKRVPTEAELLNAYGYMRGFMTSNGMPDCPRSSRYILKDFVKGRLLYCHPPPGVDPDTFHPTPTMTPGGKHKTAESDQTGNMEGSVPMPSKLDKDFFSKAQPKAHSRGVHGVTDFARAQGVQHVSTGGTASSPMSSQSSLTGKPWKKHNNRNKREKLKKVYSDKDV